MKNLLFAFVFIVIIACEKEQIDPNKFVYPLSLHASRANKQIILQWSPPVIAFEKSLNISKQNSVFADRYELFVSEVDTTNFNSLGEIQLESKELVYPENEYGKNYFFKVICYAKGANPSISNTVWIKGGINPTLNSLLNIIVDRFLDLGDVSTDGKKLLYSRNTTESCCENTHIFSYDLQSGIEEKLVEQAKYPLYSPNEDQIIFLSHFGVYTTPWPTNLGIIDLQTNEIEQLTSGENEVQSPIFSTDEKSVIYLNTFYTEPERIMQYSFENKNSTILVTPDEEMYVNAPLSLSSKDDLLSMSGRDENGNDAIFAYDQRALNFSILERSQWRENRAAFSPDGNYIAFFSDRTGRDEIWLKDIQHNEYHQLTGNEKGYPEGKFVWAKDNSKIYYTGYYNEEYGVFTIDLEL